jgi:hypothetical protein
MQEDEILEYIKRWRKVPPDQVLRYMEEMRDFLLTHMTKEGKRVFRALSSTKH